MKKKMILAVFFTVSCVLINCGLVFAMEERYKPTLFEQTGMHYDELIERLADVWIDAYPDPTNLVHNLVNAFGMRAGLDIAREIRRRVVIISNRTTDTVRFVLTFPIEGQREFFLNAGKKRFVRLPHIVEKGLGFATTIQATRFIGGLKGVAVSGSKRVMLRGGERITTTLGYHELNIVVRRVEEPGAVRPGARRLEFGE